MADGFEELYRYMRLSHYKKLFSAIHEKAGSLTATEAASVEVIYLLDQPTVNEFARFLEISQPNATYKINALVEKGYVTKAPCQKDRRECRLAVTQKFLDYYEAQLSDVRAVTADLNADERNALRKLADNVASALASQKGFDELSDHRQTDSESNKKRKKHGHFRKMREAFSRKGGAQ